MNIIIVGIGKLGYKLAETLAQDDNNITVVDLNETALARISNRLDVLAVKGNGAQLRLMKELDMSRADLCVAVTSNDETNVLICLMAKNLGCSRVAARVRNPEYANQIDFMKEHLEIDFITNPELDTAQEVARYILRGYASHVDSFAGGKVGLFEVNLQALPQLTGQSLADVEIFDQILVSAVYRDGQVIIPSGATRLQENDILHLIGRRETVTSFIKERSLLGDRQVTKKVMILGGGNAGLYLANHLLMNGLTVKIIEQNEKRCNYLAENLKGALVICGDGTDLDLLQDENLAEMDAMVSLTGNDEENLMLALLGKQQGVPKVVAKVSRSNFVPVIEQLGIDRAINPVLIASAELVRFIQGGRITSLSLLFGGQAEALEILVPDSAPIVGRPLAEARIPRGVLVGAIVRKRQVLVPRGDSIIEGNDRVIVFCLHSEIASLSKLFYPNQRRMWNEIWLGRKSPRNPSAR